MSEYIERERLLEVLERTFGYTHGGSVMKQLIETQPAADVSPVRHGKWIWDPNGMDFGLGAWECSECAVINNNLPVNVKVNPFLFSGSNYCPNCGARMDEEE